MMKRSFNFRFAIILFVLLVITVPGTYGLHYFQVQKNVEFLKNRSVTLEAENDIPKAIGYLDRYLVLRPKDNETRIHHAELLSKSAKTDIEKEQALLAVERAIREGANTPALRKIASDLAFETKRTAAARLHINELLKTTPNDAELIVLLGRCDEIDAQPAKAAEHYEKAVGINPKQVNAFTFLAKIYRTLMRTEEADKVIERMITHNPDSADARLYRATYLRVEKGTDPDSIATATKDVAIVREKFPENQDAIVASVQLAILRGERNATTRVAEQAFARKELEVGRHRHPQEIRFALSQAELELQAGRLEAAGVALTDAEQLAGKKLEDLWYVANLYVTAGKTDEAGRLLTKLGATGIAKFWIEYIDARIAMSKSKWNEAAIKLERCRKEKDFLRMTEYAVNADVFLAQCYTFLGNNDRRLEAISRAVKYIPGSQDARLAEADSRMALGQVDEALAIYLRFADRSVPARFNAVSISLAQATRRVKKNNFDWAPIQRLLDGTPEAARSTPEYIMLKADLLNVQGQVPEARKVLEAARDQQPTQAAFQIALVDLAIRENNIAGAGALIAEADKKLGDRVDIRLLKARLALAKPDGTTLKFIQSLEANMGALPAPDQNRLLLGLSSFYARLSALDETKRVMTEAAKRMPEDLSIQIRLLDLLSEQKDLNGITALVDHVRKLEGEEGAAWRYADAVRQHLIAIQDKNPAAETAARARLAEVRARRPDWDRAAVLEGIIEESQQHIDQAIEAYLRAIQLKTSSPKVVRRAVELLTSRRRFDEAAQLLNEYRDTQPSGELSRAEAILNFSRGEQTEQTVAMAVGAIDKDSKDPRDHLWLGQIYSSVKKPAEAEAAFRKAIALNPAAAQARIALVYSLIASKKLPEARAEIEAAKKDVAPAEREACLATCYEAIGDRAEAAKQYAALAEKSPNDPAVQKDRAMFHLRGGELQPAEAILRSMIDKAPINDPALASWPRRTLALAMAATGDYRRGSESLKLVEENLRLRSDSVEDQRVKALILANRPGARRQSIRSLEEMFVRIKPTPDEEFLLGRLYEADGDWTRARDIYRSLVSKRGNENPRYVVQLVRGLIQRNELGEAGQWVARLEPADNQPLPPQAVELKARLLHKQGKSAEAVVLLKGFADRTFDASKNPNVLLLVGRLMIELGLSDSAEVLIRQYVAATEAKNPPSVLALAEFLAKQNRVAEALDVCSRAATKQVEPENVASACVAVVRLGNPTEADFLKAASLIEQALRARPASPDIPVSRADLLDAQGKYDEAIAEYRAILNRQPNNILATNNLAWLLAMRNSDPLEALQRVTASIGIVGPTENLLDTQGVIYLKLGRTDEAIQALTTAIEQSPEPHIYFHLAQAQDKAKRTDDAKRSVRRAKELLLNEKNLHALERDEWRRLQALVPDA